MGSIVALFLLALPMPAQAQDTVNMVMTCQCQISNSDGILVRTQDVNVSHSDASIAEASLCLNSDVGSFEDGFSNSFQRNCPILTFRAMGECQLLARLQENRGKGEITNCLALEDN